MEKTRPLLLLFVVSIIITSGCAGEEEAKAENIYNGIAIKDFAVSPPIIEESDNVDLRFNVENIGGLDAENVELEVYGLEGWNNTVTGTKIQTRLTEWKDGIELMSGDREAGRTGESKIVQWSLRPPNLNQGIKATFPITVRADFSYQSAGSIQISAMNEDEFDRKTASGQPTSTGISVSNTESPLQVGVSKGDRPIVIDADKQGTERISLRFTFANQGNGYVTTKGKKGIFDGELTISGPGAEFGDCLQGNIKDNKLILEKSSKRLLKLRSNGQSTGTCHILINREKWKTLPTSTIRIDFELSYGYYVTQKNTIEVLGEAEGKIRPIPVEKCKAEDIERKWIPDTLVAEEWDHTMRVLLPPDCGTFDNKNKDSVKFQVMKEKNTISKKIPATVCMSYGAGTRCEAQWSPKDVSKGDEYYFNIYIEDKLVVEGKEGKGKPLLTVPEKPEGEILSCKNCKECNNKIESASIYSTIKLEKDIENVEEDCILIETYSKAIAFDCQNHNITGKNENGIGIKVKSSDKITIKNCNISNFLHGIDLLENSNENVLYKNIVCDNYIDINNDEANVGNKEIDNTCGEANTHNWPETGEWGTGCTKTCEELEAFSVELTKPKDGTTYETGEIDFKYDFHNRKTPFSITLDYGDGEKPYKSPDYRKKELPSHVYKPSQAGEDITITLTATKDGETAKDEITIHLAEETGTIKMNSNLHFVSIEATLDDKILGDIPIEESLAVGEHTVSLPVRVKANDRYNRFKKWSDDNTDNPRKITIEADKTKELTANYEDVTFKILTFDSSDNEILFRDTHHKEATKQALDIGTLYTIKQIEDKEKGCPLVRGNVKINDAIKFGTYYPSYDGVIDAYSIGDSFKEDCLIKLIKFDVEEVDLRPSITVSSTKYPYETGTYISFDCTQTTGGTSPYDCEWDFDDETTDTGNTVTHTYTAKGTYSVKLTVTDNNKNTVSTTEAISVEQPSAPDNCITCQPQRFYYNYGHYFDSSEEIIATFPSGQCYNKDVHIELWRDDLMRDNKIKEWDDTIVSDEVHVDASSIFGTNGDIKPDDSYYIKLRVGSCHEIIKKVEKDGYGGTGYIVPRSLFYDSANSKINGTFLSEFGYELYFYAKLTDCGDNKCKANSGDMDWYSSDTEESEFAVDCPLSKVKNRQCTIETECSRPVIEIKAKTRIENYKFPGGSDGTGNIITSPSLNEWLNMIFK